MDKKKTARLLFMLVGCFMPILIGVLHTITHFTDLATPEIQEHLQKEVSILGQERALWYTWGITSVMMGVSFIVIGLLNSSMLRSIPKDARVPMLSIFALILYFVFVMYVGIEFEQSFQLYGGMIGLVITLIYIFMTHKKSA